LLSSILSVLASTAWSPAWPGCAGFSDGVRDFGVRASVAKRQALIERQPHACDGFSVKLVLSCPRRFFAQLLESSERRASSRWLRASSKYRELVS
jgi:hypothetical protein